MKVTRGTFVDTERIWNETTLPILYSISLSEFILSTFFSLIFRMRNSKYLCTYVCITCMAYELGMIWPMKYEYEVRIMLDWMPGQIGFIIFIIWFELNLTDDFFLNIETIQTFLNFKILMDEDCWETKFFSALIIVCCPYFRWIVLKK